MARWKKFDSRGRLARVLAAVRGEPTGARPKTQVRIKLSSLPAPLRAVVRDESHGGMLIEAELPWLTVGSDIQAEFPDGREKAGRVHWFGVDATSAAGSARLRIFVDLSSATDGVPAQLPDVAAWTTPRRRLWPWALATAILMVASSIAVYVLARRPPPPALPPPPLTAQAAPQRPPEPVIAPQTPPEPSAAAAAPPSARSPSAASPSAAASHPKTKRKRR